MSTRSLTTRRARRFLLPGTLAAATFLATAVEAPAFFQQTKLEGTATPEIGGVWLSVQQIMPEFRLSYPKPEGRSPIPVRVGPIPADLEPITGKNPQGVVITECTDPKFCADYSVFVGDIVMKVNAAVITDVASFEKALEAIPATVLLSIRRPALKMTTARLLKLRYATEGRETAEGSVQQDTLDLKVLDVKLPFADELEKTRDTHAFFQPTPEQLEQLGKDWAKLPLNTPLVLFKGNHRFVAQASYDESLAADPALAGTKYAIVMDMEGNPITGGGGKIIDIYGIEKIENKTMEGNYVTVTMASAPFPINIEFKGRHRMFRIADWSDEDDKLREKEAASKPKEDLSKYKTVPDVPPPSGAKPAEPEKKPVGE